MPRVCVCPAFVCPAYCPVLGVRQMSVNAHLELLFWGKHMRGKTIRAFWGGWKIDEKGDRG